MPVPDQPLWRRLLREPLLHFGLGGALVFSIYHSLTPPVASDRIEITPALVEGLRADHVRRTGATPSQAEDHALLERYLDNEVAYRAARDLGLDEGDVIVRRRLVQKMEFILENAQPLPDPSDAELQAYLQAHAERYVVPERLTLTHVFLSNEHGGGDAQSVAAGLRTQLLSGGDPAKLGDPFLHGQRLTARSRTELAAMFGAPFAAAVWTLPPGAWSEPIASAYGLHLVRVEAASPGELPPLDQVRTRLREDWELEQREAARKQGLLRLRAKYGVDSGSAASTGGGAQKP